MSFLCEAFFLKILLFIDIIIVKRIVPMLLD